MLGDTRKGETVQLKKERSRADILGAAVPLHIQAEPSPHPEADLSNVVPFARRRKAQPSAEAPQIFVTAASRPAPWLARGRRDQIALLLLGSVALHAGIYALFNREAQPLASVGEQSISVELVLGTNSNAGRSNTPSPREIASSYAPQEQKPEDIRPEAAREQPRPTRPEPDSKPVEIEVAKAEAPRERAGEVKAAVTEVKPVQIEAAKAEALREQPAEVRATVAEATPVTEIKSAAAAREPAPAQALPVEATAAPEEPEIASDPKPAENAQLKPAEKRSETAEIAPAPEKAAAEVPEKATDKSAEPAQTRKPKEAEPEKVAEAKEIPQPPPPQVKRGAKDAKNMRDRAAPASAASVDSNSIGRGRSDLSTTYRGLVAAHLARFKHYPDRARSRGDQGTAVVSFTVAGDGRVTASRLLKSSGHEELDDAAVATPRRASPFPAPPAGRSETFNIPIGYAIR